MRKSLKRSWLEVQMQWARWSWFLLRFACMAVVSTALTASAQGLDPKDPLYAGCPVAEEPSERVDDTAKVKMLSGDRDAWWLLSPKRAARQACLLETCDADRKAKIETLTGPSMPLWYTAIAVAFVLGGAVGTGIGWLVGVIQ